MKKILGETVVMFVRSEKHTIILHHEYLEFFNLQNSFPHKYLYFPPPSKKGNKFPGFPSGLFLDRTEEEQEERQKMKELFDQAQGDVELYEKLYEQYQNHIKSFNEEEEDKKKKDFLLEQDSRSEVCILFKPDHFPSSWGDSREIYLH